MNKEIPNYWKALIKIGQLTEKDYWEKVEPCHILIQRAKNRVIDEILADLKKVRELSNNPQLLPDLTFSYLDMDRLLERLIEKWEAKKNDRKEEQAIEKTHT